MHFRDAKTRTVLSVFMMIAIIVWCLWLSHALLIIAALRPPLLMFVLYLLSSLMAAIFALAFPRRYIEDSVEAPSEQGV
ncbi:MAG: hypothetical protein FWC79_07090 [Oscillospiraceae bacterium]|nr:hypothetical protein [Oscillospiraceae bacterium]